jgi:endonuclease YncB( thermonuclease family)
VEHRLPVIAAILAAVALASCAGSGNAPPSYPGAVEIRVADIEFDDGDTFAVDGEQIRVLGIDTPETKSPLVGIYEDQPGGPQAAESTRVWLVRAGRIEIARDGRDPYGRTLAHVFTDGELLAIRLINARLAYENVSHFGDNGFPDLADRILDAADAAPRPAFEPPYRWRRKHQKRR